MVLLRKKKDFQTKSLLLYSQKNKAKTFSNVPISVFKDKLERVFFKKKKKKKCVGKYLCVFPGVTYYSSTSLFFSWLHFIS